MSLLLATEAASSGGPQDIGLAVPLWGWVAFVALIVGLLLVDLLVMNREAHVVGAGEAAVWSAIWISLGLAFSGVVYVLADNGATAVGQYLSGYLIEKSLSVDNLFVFVLIFGYFSVPDEYQHRVLFWGIFGALVFRGIFIAVGAVLLSQFSWVAYVFGGFLLLTGYKLATQEAIEVHPGDNPILKWFNRIAPVTDRFEGQRLTVTHEGRRMFTPLMAVLIVIETTDIVFAVDSIPAIFGVTDNAFLVFSSNAFALLGLRALYFLLADAVRRFRHLDTGVAVILGLVGVKLIVEEALAIHIATWIPLSVIAGVLGVAVYWSYRDPADPEVAVVSEGDDADASLHP